MSSNIIILITGANTGLGFETVKALCKSTQPYTILLGGRSPEKAEAAVREAQKEFPQSSSTLTAVEIDIEDDSSIARLSEQITQEYGHLDVLINNAGGQFDQQLASGRMSMREMWNKSWNVNTTSTYILTHTLMSLLLKSADPRLIFITSGTSTLGEHDNLAIAVNKSPAKGWPKEQLGLGAYRSSKTGMNMMMREWFRLLQEDGVKTWCISPGMLATGLGVGDPELLKKMGALDPSVGANFVRSVVEGSRDGDVGKAIRKDSTQPW